MRLHVEHDGPVDLARTAFVAAGGEGTVYARDGVAYKVYADPAALQRGRIEALRALSGRIPRAVLPQRLLYDDGGALVGFTMDHLADAIPFPRLCTRAFRERAGLDPAGALRLAVGLSESVAAVHRAGALVVDLNPMNLLVAPTLDAVHLIDVASWQLPCHPATAQLDAIRDRHAAALGPATDWFAFAVVAFQLLVGIHPYRGKHPSLTGLDARMRANASVLRPEVTVPPSCYPLDVLPRRWRRWFHEVLEQAARMPPPDDRAAPAWLPVAASPAGLALTRVARLPAPVRLYVEGPATVAVLDDRVLVDGAPLELPAVEAVAFASRGAPVLAWRDGRALCLADGRGRPIPVTLRADALTTAGDRLYVRAADGLVEVVLHELGDRIVPAPRLVATVLPHATRLFPGVAVQDLLGACWVHLPVRGGCHAVHLSELDGARVVDARADGTVLALLVAVDGRTDRWTVRFDPSFRTRDVHVDEGVTAGLDLLVLPSGVAVRRGEAGLELFRAGPGSAEVRAVEAPDGALVRLGAQLGLIRGDEAVRLALRSA